MRMNLKLGVGGVLAAAVLGGAAGAAYTSLKAGSVREQRADVVSTPSDYPSPGVLNTSTPSAIPAASSSPYPSPGVVPAPASPTPVSAPAPAPASPTPPPTFCGLAETVDSATVSFPPNAPIYRCSPNGLALPSSWSAGSCVVNGSFPVTGYVVFNGARYYLLANVYPGCGLGTGWSSQELVKG